MRKPTAEHFTTALIDVCTAVIEAVREAGSIPSGTLYALLSAQGCSLATFEQLMAVLVESGRITKKGDLYVKS